MDICQSNGNLLAVNGNDQIINIFDKRGAEIVKTFHGFHSLKEIFNRFMYIYSYLNFINILGDINCVRWNQRGDMLASACSDQTETAGLQWTSRLENCSILESLQIEVIYYI